MKSHSLKPFDDGRYLSEEDALKLLETIPIPKDEPEKDEDQDSLPPAVPDVTSIDNFIVLKNIRCVDADGRVFEEYPELYVAKDIIRRADVTHEYFNPYQAAEYFEQKGLFLPSMALSCNIVVRLFQTAVEKKGTRYIVKDAESKKILDQYKDYGAGYGGQAQNTAVNWGKRQILHYPPEADFPHLGGMSNINQYRPVVKLPIPPLISNMDLADALRSSVVTEYVRNLTGLEDPSLLLQVGKYFGRVALIEAPSSISSIDTRAVWFGCGYTDFDLDANSTFNCANAARGVCLNPTLINGGSP